MAVLTPGSCVAAMADLMLTIPGIGRVHQTRRPIRDEKALKGLLWDQANTRICGWMISPAGANTTVTERHPGHYGIGVKGGGNVHTTFQFQIEGYFGLDDAADTEATWRDLSWAVADEFNAYGLLDIPGVTHQLPADVEQFGFAFIAGFSLLHFARIGVGFRGKTRPTT
jgi:hypothetical protein